MTLLPAHITSFDRRDRAIAPHSFACVFVRHDHESAAVNLSEEPNSYLKIRLSKLAYDPGTEIIRGFISVPLPLRHFRTITD